MIILTVLRLYGKYRRQIFRENEFLKTISQFCSIYKNFSVKRNVPFSTIFKDDDTLVNSKQEFDCVLYGKHLFKSIPVIAFEINGGEHFGDAKKEALDKKKIKACEQHKIKLIEIPNQLVKAYEEIKQVITKISKDKREVEQLTLFD